MCGQRAVTHFIGLSLAWPAPNKILDSQDEIRGTVGANVLVTLHQFIQLQAHQARHCGCGGGYGWDDLPGNELTL